MIFLRFFQVCLNILQEVSKGRHQNIISALGCCKERAPLAAILELAPYGSLLEFLRRKGDWASTIVPDHDFIFNILSYNKWIYYMSFNINRWYKNDNIPPFFIHNFDYNKYGCPWAFTDSFDIVLFRTALMCHACIQQY